MRPSGQSQSQSVVIIVLRIFALILVLRTATQVFPFIFYASAARELVFPIVHLIASLFVGLILFVRAYSISSFITYGAAEEVQLGKVELADLYSLGFLVVGLFYTVGYFASVLNWVVHVLKKAGGARVPLEAQFSGFGNV